MRNPYDPRIGQGMFDWIRSSRSERPREIIDRPRGEGYYETSQWPPAPSRYPMRQIPQEFQAGPLPSREEPGMFKWIRSSKPAMSGNGGSSSGWLVGLSFAVGFGIAAALAYFSKPEQPKA